MLGGGDDALCLHSPHVTDTHAAGELGIFAVRLLQSAPAGIPGDVEDRRQRQPGADGPELATDHVGDLLDQRRVPGGGEVDALRKLRRPTGAEPTGGLFVDDCRDPQPRVLDEVALDLVPQFRHPLRPRPRLNGDPADLADAVCGREGQAIQCELAVDEESREPHAAELRALLLQCHARHEFVDVGHEASSPAWAGVGSVDLSPPRSVPALLCG